MFAPANNYKKTHSFTLPIIVIILLIVLTILITLYPPLMIVGLDIAVIGGAILLVTVIANIWHHEIQRIAGMMKDLKTYLNIHPAQQEEYEQYYVLSSVNQSIGTLTEKKALNKEEKKQLRYLKRQKFKNMMLLGKRGTVWALKLIIPLNIDGYPTLIDNLKTIFKEPKFLALKMTIIIWFLFSLFILFYFLRR
jgi:hypothetical protein